jgi:hypothetical protein
MIITAPPRNRIGPATPLSRAFVSLALSIDSANRNYLLGSAQHHVRIPARGTGFSVG